MVSAATSLSTIDLRVLGPLSVVINGRGVPLGGPRQMAVLARLMFAPGQVVSMDQLVDSVWDGDEPAQPQVAIRSYISNLRRAIEPNRPRRSTDSCIPSCPPGYTLEVDPSCVDLTRFETLINAGRSQLAAGEFASATIQLRDALALWRGEPFAGLSDSEIFTAHRSQLVQLRETASEMLFEAHLERGDHLTVVSTIEAAIAENPLRERLTELAMVAFYRSGRQADALEIGQRLRTELLDRMGIDPSPEIAELELKILNHDRSLAPAKSASSGRRGLRERLTLVPTTASSVEPQPLDVPPMAAGPTTPEARALEARVTPEVSLLTPLPVRPPPVRQSGGSVLSVTHREGAVGRFAELEALAAIRTNLFLGRSTTAVITGEPGIGKTKLVQAVAEDLMAAGIPVAWSRSMQSEQQRLWPWAQMIVSLIEGREPLIAREAWDGLEPLHALGPSVISALGLASEDRAKPAATFSNAEIFLAVTQLLQRISHQSPLVLVFEDLQWADHLSVALLNFAASTLAEWPIGFVVTWRQTDVEKGPLSTELRNLARVPYLVRVGLEGIDGQATAELAEQIGWTLSEAQAQDLQRRCGGSPLFLTELLSDQTRWPDVHDVGGVFSFNLTDTVMARVDRLHPQANSLLTIGALFRTSFSLQQIGPLFDMEMSETLAILSEAVRGGILREVAGGGWYEFHCPLMAEVLSSGLLTSERAVSQGRIGRHLADLDRQSYETAFHLGKSDVLVDRQLAARIALDLFEGQPDLARVSELDELVNQVLLDTKGGSEIAPAESLVADGRFYLSWRAWLDGRGDDWNWEANRSFAAVLKQLANPERSNPVELQLESTDEAEDDSAADVTRRLQERRTRGAMAAIGHPALFTGPLSDAAAEENLEETFSNLTLLLERLPNDDQGHWMVQVQSSYVKYLLAKPGSGSLSKAVREAKKAAGSARKKLPSSEVADVLLLLLHRFSDGLSAAEHLELSADILRSGAPLRRELLVARYTYSKLLECERRHDAAAQAQQIWTRAKTVGSHLEVAEARALHIRHLMWSGRLDEAEEHIERGLSDWKQLGLSGSVTFGRQGYHLRRLRNQPIDPDGVIARTLQANPWPDRVGKQALVWAEIGNIERSKGYLDSAVESMTTSQTSHSDLAQMAAAAALLDHQSAGVASLEPLKELGDRLILSTDRFLILGPASLYAGLAARAAGLQSTERQLTERALTEIKRRGGSVEATIAMLSRLESPTCMSMNDRLGGLEVDEDVNIENLSNPTPSNS